MEQFTLHIGTVHTAYWNSYRTADKVAVWTYVVQTIPVSPELSPRTLPQYYPPVLSPSTIPQNSPPVYYPPELSPEL